MKKMMIMASAIIMAAAGYANNVETKPFESVKVNVPARVRFVTGDNYGMGVRSVDSIAAKNSLWSIEDGVLKIRQRYENNGETPTDVCITIVSPVEPKLTVGRNFKVTAVTDERESNK